MNILQEQLKAQEQGKSYALLTVVKTKGATAANPSKKMMVFEDGGIIGTVGGGKLEMMCIRDAKEVLQGNIPCRLADYDLSDKAEDTAAEKTEVTVLIEAVRPGTTVVVLGAGHVGAAVLKAARLLNFQTILIDNRPKEQIQDKIALADRFILCADYERGVVDASIPDGAYYFCATWGHVHDKNALKGALQKNAAYVGMIGSTEKTKEIFSILKEDGFTGEQLEKVYAPVGLDICNGSPEEIGFAVVAEMLKIKNNGMGGHCKNSVRA